MIRLKFKKEMLTSQGKQDLDIDLNIAEGEITALYGASGVGKTTLLRVLAGLTKVREGFLQVGQEVWLDTEKHINLRPQKRKIGFVFQEPALFPHLTARQNVAFAASSERTDELLKLVHMEELQNSRPDQLSGGQRQRISLARAVASGPRMLLLDEPFTSLDTQIRSKMLDEIQQIHRLYKTTTILVTHDISEVFTLAKSVCVLEGGKITREGSPSEVFNSAANELGLSGTVIQIIGDEAVVLCGNETVTVKAGKAKAGEKVFLKIDPKGLTM